MLVLFIISFVTIDFAIVNFVIIGLALFIFIAIIPRPFLTITVRR